MYSARIAEQTSRWNSKTMIHLTSCTRHNCSPILQYTTHGNCSFRSNTAKLNASCEIQKPKITTHNHFYISGILSQFVIFMATSSSFYTKCNTTQLQANLHFTLQAASSFTVFKRKVHFTCPTNSAGPPIVGLGPSEQFFSPPPHSRQGGTS